MSSPAKWGDLGPRIMSGVVIATLGIGGVWIGGWFYLLLVAVVTGLLVWETARMTNPQQRGEAVQVGLLAAVALVLAQILPADFTLPVVLAPALVAVGLMQHNRLILGMFSAWIMLGGLGFLLLRAQGGVTWMSWLVLVVIASDMAGYFVGKTFGGPKFWPRISPKKTWSGTLGGWLFAALVGLGFVLLAGAGGHLIWISVIVAFAAQMGDIAESTLKRRMGVKDSSQLIPGHGGVFDRFDGMVGASALLLILFFFNLLHITAF